MKTDQTELWTGPFGDDYQARNALTEEEVAKRVTLWENIFKVIYMNCGDVPKSVLEIGAGQGPNIAALHKLSMSIQKPIKLFATEINQKARMALSSNVPTCEILDSIPKEPIADLVLTYGVLIHTHPAHLVGLMRQIHAASRRWIVACEYFAPQSRPITYRGEKDALWLDDYGKYYIENFSLRIVGYGFCWKVTTGLDNITQWTFEKAEKMN